MARVLFDPHSLQAWQHRRDLGHEVPPYLGGLPTNPTPRLRALTELLTGVGLEPVFAEGELPTLSGLNSYGILVTGSRLKPFTDSEVADLVRFAERGGGLLIMSNHGASESAPNDLTRYDRGLVRELGVTLECTVFSAPRGEARRENQTLAPARDHPTMQGIRGIAINNCSSLVCEGAPHLVEIPHDWKDALAGGDPKGRGFALAIDERIDGRVLIMTDSGFIGTPGTHVPGPGMIDQADNRNLMLNIFSWLHCPSRREEQP